MAFSCPHLAVAVAGGSPLAGVAYLEYGLSDDPEFTFGCWFCPACVAAYRLPASGAVHFDSEDFPSGAKELFRPMCPGCFLVWHAAGNA
jgi:hypothetical protein